MAGAVVEALRDAMPAITAALSMGPATLERPHTMTDADRRSRVGSLTVNATVTAGNTALVLRANDSGPLTGTLPDTIVLTIGGQGYAVDGDATAASNLISVTLATPLAADANAGDPVTLGAGALYTFSAAHADQDALDQIPPELIGTADRVIWLAQSGAPVTPRLSDRITLDGAKAEVVGFVQDSTTSGHSWGLACR